MFSAAKYLEITLNNETRRTPRYTPCATHSARPKSAEMPVDLVLLGPKLRGYREQLQLDIAEVSERTGIPIERMQTYELGKAVPSGDEILILADFYKCDYHFFISNEKVGPFDETDLLFRRYGTEFRKEDRWAVQEFLFLCTCEHYLMGQLGRLRKLPSVEVSAKKNRPQAQEAAAQVRTLLGYGNRDLHRNVFNDVRELGIHIFRRRLGNSNISGLTIHTPNSGVCILINYDQDLYRQRFSAAHEACHALLDAGEEVMVSLKGGNTNLEVRANYFASYLLIPPEILAAIPSNWSDVEVARWANELQVSTQALAIALVRDRMITPEQKALLKKVKVPREIKRDPELPKDLGHLAHDRKKHFLEKGLSSQYVGLCFDAYDEGHVSAARVAEMLLTDIAELRDLAALFGRKMKRGD